MFAIFSLSTDQNLKASNKHMETLYFLVFKELKFDFTISLINLSNFSFIQNQFLEKIFALIGNFALNEFLGGNLKFALIEIALIEARTNRGIAV